MSKMSKKTTENDQKKLRIRIKSHEWKWEKNQQKWSKTYEIKKNIKNNLKSAKTTKIK